MRADFPAVFTRPSEALFGRRSADLGQAPPGVGEERAALLGALSREIGQASASVAGLAQALRDERTCEPLGLNQGRAVEGVLHAGRRLMALAQELTDETAVAASAEPPARLDLALALHGARARQAAALIEAGVRIMGPGAAPGPAVLAPPGVIETLLDGLIAAAGAFARRGSALVLEVRWPGQAVVDVGVVGSPPDEDRLSDSLAPGGELARWRRQALRLGGDLRAHRAPEVGAVVRLILPGEAGGAGASSLLPRFDPVSGVVLLAGAPEADRALVRLVASALGLDGLHTAPAGGAALDAARELHPDVVIADLSAPRSEAVEFACALDADGFTREARRIALAAGEPTSRDRRRLREAGYRHVLARPLDVDDLAFALHGCLATRRAEG